MIKKLKSPNSNVKSNISFIIFFLVFHFSFLISRPSIAYDFPEFRGQEVIVTATRFPLAKSEISSSTSVITRREIEASAAENVAEIIRQVAGVDIRKLGYLGANASVQLRGGNSQQTLILIDGERVNSPSLGTADLADFLLADVERIEIIKSPLSSLYGADAVGGVINIITQKEKNSFEMAYGSFGTQKYSLSASRTLGGFQYSLSATELKSDGFRTNSDYQAQNYYLKLGAGNLSLQLKKYVADKGTPGVPASNTDKTTASLPNDRQRDNNTFLNLSLENKIGKQIQTKTKFYLTELEMFNHYMDWFIPGTFYDDRYQSYIRGVEIQNDIHLSRNLNLMLGGEWRENETRGPLTGTHLTHNYAAFLQTNLNLWKNTNLNLGMRADRNTAFSAEISPHLGVVLHLFADLIFRGSLSEAYRAPTMNELYWNQPAFLTYGNPNLKPETSQGYSLELEKTIDKTATLTVSYYKNELRDLIKWNQTGPTAWQPVNIDKARIEGGEFGITKEFGRWFKGFANYTYQKSKNLTAGKDIVYSPENKYNLGITHLSPFGLESNLTLNQVGERYTDTANTSKLNSYSVVNLKISQSWGGTKVALACQNLFNEDYSEAVGTAAGDFATRGYPMPGRRFTLELTLL